MKLEELYKVRLEMRNKVSSIRIDLREAELNLEAIEEQINRKERADG